MPSGYRSCQEQHKAPGFWNFYKLTYVLSVVSLKGHLQNYIGLRLGFHLFFYQKKAVKKKISTNFFFERKMTAFTGPPAPLIFLVPLFPFLRTRSGCSPCWFYFFNSNSVLP